MSTHYLLNFFYLNPNCDLYANSCVYLKKFSLLLHFNTFRDGFSRGCHNNDIHYDDWTKRTF